MANILKLISPIPPSVNHYTAIRSIMKNGKPMAMMYETKEAKEYKKEFKEYVLRQIKLQNWDLPVTKTQHFYFDCVFYFDRVDKDANNYFKCLLDSITETQSIWVDDNVVCERVNRIYYNSSLPRIEIKVYPVDYIGIFDNQDQLDTFENKCKTCKRYSKNCSILNKAIEGRVQDEINNLNCNKYKGVINE